MKRLVFGLLVALVLISLVRLDHQHPMLPDQSYCYLGAGVDAVVQQSASQRGRSSLGNGGATLLPFVCAQKVCVHGSLWEGWTAHLNG